MTLPQAPGGSGTTPHLSKKLCLLGATSVGKTSLVQRYVQNSFDDTYRVTIGVNIHSMDVAPAGQAVRLLLWDLEGLSDPLQCYRKDYVYGAHGFVVVIDPTRTETLDIARSLQQIAVSVAPDAPFVGVVNKSDLRSKWELRPEDLQALRHVGWPLFETSAKTGEQVREAFEAVTAMMLESDARQTAARRAAAVGR
ncbi:MAG: Rab family GTPase [Nitrospiraceae bacterium]